MARGMEVFLEWVDEAVKAYEAREAMLTELAARALATAEPEYSPAVIVHWSCPKPTEQLRSSENVTLEWVREQLTRIEQGSLLDRYRFPFL